MGVGACWFLLFFFVPETFWDRTPRPKSRAGSRISSVVNLYRRKSKDHAGMDGTKDDEPWDGTQSTVSIPDVVLTAPANTPADTPADIPKDERPPRLAFRSGMAREGSRRSPLHVGFSADYDTATENNGSDQARNSPSSMVVEPSLSTAQTSRPKALPFDSFRVEPKDGVPPTPELHNFNSPHYNGVEGTDSDYLSRGRQSRRPHTSMSGGYDGSEAEEGKVEYEKVDENGKLEHTAAPTPGIQRYTTTLRQAPKRSFVQQLRPWEGRLKQDNWFRVALRPFILYAYPAVLWSSIVYSCSVGWLIVISESMALIYRDKDSYNFSALATGLVYLSPFIGGILGTAVAGKLSDVVVMYMSKRNGGLYEPEFRLVMVIPVALTTVIGLMGFGWSAEEKDAWIVPTIFFGTISFGCSLGSTTAITFCVDSYRQYAGEALVTLNFSKNVFHGLVFSLFVVSWLEANGPKQVYLALGGIQLAALSLTIPMYIYGKRARMWTARMNLLEKF